MREAEAEAELEFLSPAARLDAARKEQESSQTRAARQWESELARAERRASLPMVTLLRDVEGDDADAVDKGANEEGGDAELGGGRGPAGGAAAVTPSAASARSRVSRCVHSGRTWTWDSRKTDEPIAPADDRVEIPDDMHEEEEEERVESAYVDLSAGEAEPRSAHAAFATSAATAHATPADAATSAAARAWLERGSSLQILQSLPQSPGEPAAGRAPHAPMPPAPPPAVTKAAAEGVAVCGARQAERCPNEAHAALAGGRQPESEGSRVDGGGVQGIGGFGACDGSLCPHRPFAGRGAGGG